MQHALNSNDVFKMTYPDVRKIYLYDEKGKSIYLRR